jgi:choline-sulfatase
VKSLAPAGVTTMLYSSGGDRRATSDYALLQKAFAILERKEADRPVCIFLAMSEPHPPYTAPDSFGAMYKPADLPPLIPPGLAKKPNFHAAIRRKFGLERASDADLRQVRATYYGQVSYADWLLGEMLEALDRTGRTKDTALFVASDHGDYAGDYGLIEKWPSGMESCLTHVPLIGRMPGGTPGVVARDMVELYDIMATFLELGGARAAHTHFARSLLPQMQGRAGDPNRAAFTEGGYNDYEPQAFEPKLGGLYAPKTELQNDEPETIRRCASIKTSRYTYVARPSGQGELYDRKADPGETRNLIDERGSQATVDQMQQRLLNWYINTSGVPDTAKDARGLPPYYATEPKKATPEELARILDQ